jgi:hypothetical protein
MPNRSEKSINTLVIHCSATPNGKAFTAKDIDGWHHERGFRRQSGAIVNSQYPLGHIGYHYVILLDGTVQNGRPLDETGAHAQGHNTYSVGICMIGTDKFSLAQWEALDGLVHSLLAKLEIKRICGHRDLSPDKNGDGKIQTNEWTKTCPGFDVSEWWANRQNPKPEHDFNVANAVAGVGTDGAKQSNADAGERRPGSSALEGISPASPINVPGELVTLEKPWWQSKTILGTVAAVLPTVSDMLGIDYSLIQPYAGDIITIAGAILAIIGRKTAVAAIK